ncbi:uncharacterized protein FA14DRAFT_153818 [Meira miltonrushii]|uniref:Secreted protein n=1 Tax=Meira miltonrushii TaxID=1280837 RepID=A0A316VLR5_9BASI|nr:uncharacterized protein FA14DRAFT_153818 [Meira miltonrushii]PWN38496.1 hypothetical protein FA14DRAFT_153818 [Meira miltonrushii]
MLVKTLLVAIACALVVLLPLRAADSTDKLRIEIPTYTGVNRRPNVTPDDLSELNKSIKFADGPGGSKKKSNSAKTLTHSHTVRRKKELGASSFNPSMHRIKTPVPGLKALKSFGGCSSPKAADCHTPTRKSGKGKEASSSSSTKE